MTLTLHLGVVDIPYVTNVPEPQRRVSTRQKRGGPVKAQPSKPPSGGETTGDVAEILEEKYGVMEVYYELHQADVVAALEESLEDQIDSLMSGAPVDTDAFGAAASRIEAGFRDFLDRSEMAYLVPGVPTQAAQDGVNHRLKLKKGPTRPSFVDIGLYQSSMKAWVD